MARTRSTRSAPADSKTSTETKSTASKYSLPAQSDNTSKIFILPSKATREARIVTLPNPRHARPSRYLVCPETGIYEFTKVSAPKTTPRSWLIENNVVSTQDGAVETTPEKKAHVSTGQELYLATAIDPLFLLLPALADVKAAKGDHQQKRLFLCSDDHFDKLLEESSHLAKILRCEKTRKLMEARMAAICDTVEAGDESMFRLSEDKLLSVVLRKAERMSESGLPPSMEEKFVKKTLEAPILVQKREPIPGEGVPATNNAESQGSSTPQTDSHDSQSTVTSTDTASSSVSQPSTAATSFTEETAAPDVIVRAIEATPEITRLQRLRVAFNFICSGYIAPAIQLKLEELVKSKSSPDFTPLDEYVTKLAKFRADAVASRSVGDYSRKHTLDEEEDEALAKKRKLEDEKKKKSMESRAVRELKKVNTKGMKKMSDFFKKK